jgi:hypothetical protein
VRSAGWGLAVAVAWLLLGVGSIGRVGATPRVFPGAHWEEASPESRGLDPVALRAAIEFLTTKAPRDGVDELVIIRHGVLVWRGPAVDRVHRTWSCTKSFVSTVLGLLVDELFVIPDWDMVVVRLGQDQTTGFAIMQATWAEFLRRLGAALTTRAAAPRE